MPRGIWPGRKKKGEAAGTIEGVVVFLVGEITVHTEMGTVWEFKGAFADAKSAISVCTNAQHFCFPTSVGSKVSVGPNAIGVTFPKKLTS